MSKTELWRRARLDPDTGRRGLRDLLAEGKIEADHSLSRSLGSVVALSIGTESARGALVDPNGRIDFGFECPPHPGQLTELSRTLLLNRLADLAYAILEAGVSASPGGQLPLIGVSVAWPSPLDAETKHPSITVLPHPQWARDPLPVTDAVAARLQLDQWSTATGSDVVRSHAINDANAVAISAAFDKTRDRAMDPITDGRSGPILVIRIGGSIGAGIVLLATHCDQRSAFLDSHLIEGRGFAGEIAHLPISAADIDELGKRGDGLIALTPSHKCHCGRKICLESVASARAVVKRVRNSGLLENDVGDTEGIRVMMEKSDTSSAFARALYQAGSLIGRSLAGPIMLLGPRQITVTGSSAQPALIEGLEARRGDWKYIQGEPGPEVMALKGRENSLAPAHGAGLVALRGQLYRRFDDFDGLPGVAVPYDTGHLQKLKYTLTGKVENRPELIA
ncbi:MAG: ROK family protein [Thermoleophilia bacterium]|nr:ROK family protein [Thermoleophilia bacterium]